MCDNTGGEPLAWMLRRGSAGSNTAADHLTLTDAAIAALPPGHRRRLMITCDGAGASHALVAHLDKLAARRGYELTYSVGWALGEREKTALRMVPEQAWQIAIDSRGEVRERRADDACANAGCAHRACWIEEAHVTELTGLLRCGPGGDQLRAWPAAMRVFARRERPHPGAQLTLFEAGTAGGIPCGPRTGPPARRLAGRERLHRRRAPGPGPGRGRDPHRERLRNRPFPVL